MGNILYIVAAILVIAWLIGFGYATGGLVYILLVLALISILVNIIGGHRRRI